MDSFDIGVVSNLDVHYQKINTSQKFEQGRSKMKPRHNEFVKTLFVKVDKPNIILNVDGITNSIIPSQIKDHFDEDVYAINTYTDSSLIESVMLCIDNELITTFNLKDRLQILNKYLSVLDGDMLVCTFWKKFPERKTEFRRQMYGGSEEYSLMCDALSSSFRVNILLYNADIATDNLNMFPTTGYMETSPLIIVIRRNARYLPVITRSGCVHTCNDIHVLKLLSDMKIIEFLENESNESDSSSNDG